MNLLFNRISAIAALIIAGVVACAFWDRRDNGRFVYVVTRTELLRPIVNETLIDTRTGTIYVLNSDSKFWAEIHPQTGLVKYPNRSETH